jgi:Family of unknown function (DUF6390)
MFARYAYPPNELGYCGPDDASVLLRQDPQADAVIAEHARQFDGAWAYLELIASAAHIDDPLDARVVEAYWLGNDLLDLLEADEVMAYLRARFPEQVGASWVPGRAHHGYQVFAVYPWVRLLYRTGNHRALEVLDQCRIRWGDVLAVDGERVHVRCQALEFRDGTLVLGAPGEQSAALSAGGRGLVSTERGETRGPPVRAGDIVAMHWDWVCDVLTADQAQTLRWMTEDQLGRTNASREMAAGA